MWPWCVGLRVPKKLLEGFGWFWKVLRAKKINGTLERHATKQPSSTPPVVPGAPQRRPGSADFSEILHGGPNPLANEPAKHKSHVFPSFVADNPIPLTQWDKSPSGKRKGKTFGLNWQGLGDERISGSKLLDLAAKALRWRWLIIDEISMVSAELLARLELRCRELVRDLAQSKYAKDQAYARPFGGLNVILAGDMWHLPPPRGTFLGDVPWEWLKQ